MEMASFLLEYYDDREVVNKVVSCGDVLLVFLIGNPQKDSGRCISFRNATGKGLPVKGKWGSSPPYLF